MAPNVKRGGTNVMYFVLAEFSEFYQSLLVEKGFLREVTILSK